MLNICFNHNSRKYHPSLLAFFPFLYEFCFQVFKCRVVRDPHTRESLGYGFVTMETTEDAERCIKHLHNTVFDGRLISVEKVNIYHQLLSVSICVFFSFSFFLPPFVPCLTLQTSFPVCFECVLTFHDFICMMHPL